MNLKYFKLWIVRVTLGLLLLGISSITAAAQKSLYGYTRIEWPYSTVEVRKPDGTVSAAKFLSEIILLQDGRANGGFGIWEQNPPDILSLYHVVEGKQNGPYYTFKAQRLAPLPALEITVALRPASGPFYDGSVRFLVDASAAAGGLFSLEATGSVEQSRAPISLLESFFTFAFINAPPQAVEVETATDSYLSNFNHVALVFPSVGAIGLLRLNSRNGEPVNYHHNGPGAYKSVDGGQTWMIAASMENDLTPGDAIMIMIRPHPDPSEPCRIYDIAGTQVNSMLHFEAEALITLFPI